MYAAKFNKLCTFSCIEFLFLPIPVVLLEMVRLNRNLSEKFTCIDSESFGVFDSDGSSKSSGGGGDGGSCGPSIDGLTVETAISPTQGCFL